VPINILNAAGVAIFQSSEAQTVLFVQKTGIESN